MPDFQVHLDAFHGPLDLLLYLVKKEELAIAELPLASVAEQYLEHVAVLERLDPDSVGDFLDVASLLLEIKSRAVLPSAEEVADGDPLAEADIEAPGDLVERLLQFKEYRDAAARLETLRLDWSKRHARAAGAPPRRPVAGSERPIEGVELWDLVSAFARVMRSRREPEPVAMIADDDTPIHVHMARVAAALQKATRPIPFENLFPTELVPKATLIGVFVAMLELIRYRHAVATQTERYGPITLLAGPVPYEAPVSSVA